MANKAYGAGIRHAELKNALAEVVDVEAVVNSEASMAIESTEIKGDDEVKVTFYQSQKAEITLEANALSLDAIEIISGTSIDAVTGPPTANEIAIGTDGETNPPFIEITTQTIAKDVSTGTIVTVEIVYHKVQLMLDNITQALESELPQNIKGTAYKTDKDVEGNALASKRIATVRIVDADTTA